MNPLEILALKPGCTKEDVKRNFRRLSFLYHPDKHPNDKASEESFKKIVNAYEAIRNDPTLLSKNVVLATDDIISTEVKVTVEDLYFEKKKSITIKRVVPCHTCCGFGTTDIDHGLCELCKGTGYIDNKILGMMKRRCTCKCPSCNGLGVKKDYICEDCNGKKTKKEAITYSFKLTLKDYNNKCVFMNGKGNQYPHDQTGDILIKLNIIEDPVYSVEKDCLCIDYEITPTQNLIGDECKIDIFGKIFKFKVPLLNDKITLEDKRKEFVNSRKIIIRTLVSKPVLNKETIELYKKILIAEKTAATIPS